MKVKVIYESDIDAALLGTGLSFGRTSDMSIEDIQDNKDGIRDKMLDVVRKLAPMGNGHNKAIRQVIIALDVTAPLYWWKQMATYQVGTVTQSESTMHTIMKKPFTPDDFELDHPDSPFVRTFIGVLNSLRTAYLESDNAAEKRVMWRDLIQYLPESYLQRRIITANYETLRCIFRQRKGHKLDEWATFIDDVYNGLKYNEFVRDIYYA